MMNDTKYRPTNNYKPSVSSKDKSPKQKDEPFSQKFTKSFTPKTDRNKGFKLTCFSCGTIGHLCRVCPKNPRKTPSKNAASNLVETKKINK